MTENAGRPPHIRAYLAVFAVLMVLTAVTVAASRMRLPPAPAILLGLMIATVKASLVGAFFMHLKGERALIYGLLGMTVLLMAVLFLLPIADTVATTGVGATEAQATPARAEHVP